MSNDLLELARNGDIQAFHELYKDFQETLKSYLFRFSADRNLVEDIFHDTFIQSFDKLKIFEGRSSLKTWVFTIATNRMKNQIAKEKRWRETTQEDLRKLAYAEEDAMALINDTHQNAQYSQFMISEHIDYCLTCVGKMLPQEQQICVLLKEVYDFKSREIAEITNLSLAKVKHALRDGRGTMTRIFDEQCALVNKQGACFQCSGLNKKFNPKAEHQAELVKIKFYSEAVVDDEPKDKERALDQRLALVKSINPLRTDGVELHDAFLALAKRVNA